MTLGDRVAIMAGGVIRQHGSPMELYRAPVDRFVAGFLGTPPMNFVTGTLSTAGPAPSFTETGSGGQSFPITARPSLPQHGAQLIIGIRPTHFSLTPTQGGAAITATVRAVEPLGEQCDVQAITPAGTVLTARIPLTETPPMPVGTITLHAHLNHLTPFEPGEFGKNLAL